MNNHSISTRFHTGWRGERSIPYKDDGIRKGLKRTISVSGGLGLLQMVSEPNTGRCANVDAGLQGDGL